MIYLKYLKYATIALILLAAFVLMPMFYNKWRQAEEKIDQVAKYATTRDQEITYYKNELQREVAKGNALVMDRQAFKELKDDFQYLTEEFKGVKNNLKNVEQVTRITASIIDTLKIPTKDSSIVINNTNYLAKTFEYKDNYNKVTGVVVNDSASIKLDIKVPLEMVVLWERSKILGIRIGRKKYHMEGTSKNESVKITGLENIKIQKN
jgi:hypothetical protein